MYVHFHSKCQVFIKMYISADCVLFRKRNKTNILPQTSFGSALRTWDKPIVVVIVAWSKNRDLFSVHLRCIYFLFPH